jgi:hypothetical protein
LRPQARLGQPPLPNELRTSAHERVWDEKGPRMSFVRTSHHREGSQLAWAAGQSQSQRSPSLQLPALGEEEQGTGGQGRGSAAVWAWVLPSSLSGRFVAFNWLGLLCLHLLRAAQAV